MPGGNRMGPAGQGPRSGRGAGYCGGNQGSGAETSGQQGSGGRRRGRGGGGRGQGGRGRRNMFHATGLTGWQRVIADRQATDEPIVPSPESQSANQVDRAQQEQATMLKEQATEIFRSLQDIQHRLAELEGLGEEEQPTESTDSSVE